MRQQTGKNLKIWEFHKQLKKAMDILQMDESYAQRSLNVGFSGGEKKKSEILQLMLLNPSLAILDETDSGLDVDAVRLVSKGVEEYQKNQNGALLIITHSTRILDALHVDYTHIMVDGKIVQPVTALWLIRSTRKATNPLSVRLVWQTPGTNRYCSQAGIFGIESAAG